MSAVLVLPFGFFCRAAANELIETRYEFVLDEFVS